MTARKREEVNEQERGLLCATTPRDGPISCHYSLFAVIQYLKGTAGKPHTVIQLSFLVKCILQRYRQQTTQLKATELLYRL